MLGVGHDVQRYGERGRGHDRVRGGRQRPFGIRQAAATTGRLPVRRRVRRSAVARRRRSRQLLHRVQRAVLRRRGPQDRRMRRVFLAPSFLDDDVLLQTVFGPEPVHGPVRVLRPDVRRRAKRRRRRRRRGTAGRRLSGNDRPVRGTADGAVVGRHHAGDNRRQPRVADRVAKGDGDGGRPRLRLPADGQQPDDRVHGGAAQARRLAVGPGARRVRPAPADFRPRVPVRLPRADSPESDVRPRFRRHSVAHSRPIDGRRKHGHRYRGPVRRTVRGTGPVQGPRAVRHRTVGRRTTGRGRRDRRVRQAAEADRPVRSVRVRGRSDAERTTAARRHRFRRHVLAGPRPPPVVRRQRHHLRGRPGRRPTLRRLRGAQRYFHGVSVARARRRAPIVVVERLLLRSRAAELWFPRPVRRPHGGPVPTARLPGLPDVRRSGVHGLRDRRPQRDHQRPAPGPGLPAQRRPDDPIA